MMEQTIITKEFIHRWRLFRIELIDIELKAKAKAELKQFINLRILYVIT